MATMIKVSPTHYKNAQKHLRQLRAEVVRTRTAALAAKQVWLNNDKTDEKWLDRQWLVRDAAIREYEDAKRWYFQMKWKVDHMIPAKGADPRGRYC